MYKYILFYKIFDWRYVKLFILDDNESFYDSDKQKEIEKEIQKFSTTLQKNIITKINTYLKNVNESNYEVEEPENFTAYGALIKNEANCNGIIEAFGAILTELNFQFQIIDFKNSEFIGIKVNNTIYSPYVEKLCERNSINFEDWIKSHS